MCVAKAEPYAERKAHSMQNALEEARTLLEQADRNRRSTEAELADVNEALSDTTVSNQAIAAAKRKLESEMATLHVSRNFRNLRFITTYLFMFYQLFY